jgi:hypothetical protein
MLQIMARPAWWREWAVALAAYALLVAPFGCQLGTLLDPVGGGGAPVGVGFFVNDDAESPAIAGARDSSGNEFFVFGVRDADGNLAEIDAIHVIQRDGAQAYLIFESGRPVYARGPDGSYLEIRYTQLESLRLSAAVTIHDADTGTEATETVTVDLAASAGQVAERIEALTGEPVAVPDVSAATSKSARRSGLAAIGLAVLVAVPVAVAVNVAIVALGQVLVGLFRGVAAVLQTALLVILSPLFLLSAILNGAVIEIELATLPEIFITIPDVPRIIIE